MDELRISYESLSLNGQIDLLCDRFEHNWKNGAEPSISEYLGIFHRSRDALSQTELKSFLIELVKIDLSCRWKLGRNVPPDVSLNETTVTQSSPNRLLTEDYLDRHPSLGTADSVEIGIIAEEYRARHLWGDKPTVEEFTHRFHGRKKDLQKELEVVEADLSSVDKRLNVRLYENYQVVFSDTICSPIELGRQRVGEPEPFQKVKNGDYWRIILARLREDSVSRRHATLTVSEDGSLILANVSSTRSIVFQDSSKLTPGKAATIGNSVLFSFSGKVIRISRIDPNLAVKANHHY